MPDRTPNQNAAEILRLVADIQKDIGELSIAMIAQHSALCDLVPNFENRYEAQMGYAKVLQVKRGYEQKIRVLLEAAQTMSQG